MPLEPSGLPMPCAPQLPTGVNSDVEGFGLTELRFDIRCDLSGWAGLTLGTWVSSTIMGYDALIVKVNG